MRIAHSFTRRLIGPLCLLSAFLTLVALPGGQVSAARQHQQVAQITYFTATVIQGPDKGLSMTGKMELQLAPSGAFTGTLVRTKGSALKVSGQISGAAFNIVILLGGGKAVFGSGSAMGDILNGNGAAGGLFTGPSKLDVGSWGTCYGIHTSSGTCYGIYVD